MSASSVYFAGLTFQGPTRAAIAAAPPLTLVITVNADFIVTAHADPRFARIINENCATFDGQIPYTLARRLARPRGAPIEKISGSDLVPELLEKAAQMKRKVFLLGATPEANAAAVLVARHQFGVEVEGYSPPVAAYPFPDDWRLQCRARIENYRPDYIFVALGAPKQEFWMDEERTWLEPLGVRLCLGCGGSLDFLSGRIKRAPGWVQTIGLEGVYRAFAQPQWFRIKRLLRSFLMFKYIFR